MGPHQAHREEGKIVAAKMTVYAGDTDEYFTKALTMCDWFSRLPVNLPGAFLYYTK
jgi:hypothetical protein